MRRSGGVTAAAIVLLFGSGLLFLAAVLVVVTPLGEPSDPKWIALMLALVYGIPAAWGIATAIGILQLRTWARISMIILSIFGICFSGMIAATAAIMPVLTRNEPDFSVITTQITMIVLIAFASLPLGVAIWWLILFTRKRVAVEFTSRRSIAGALPTEEWRPVALSPQLPPEIPISIRVIAVLFLIGGAFALLSLPYKVQQDMPGMVLGILVNRWIDWGYLVLFGGAQLLICIAIFKKRAWALDGLIAITFFSMMNMGLFAVSPSRHILFEKMNQSQSLPANVSAEAMTDMFSAIFPVSIGLGVILALVGLYFLFSRRKAFRVACGEGHEVV